MEVFYDLERQLSQDRDPLVGGVDLEQSLATHRAERSCGAEAPDRRFWVPCGCVRLRWIAQGRTLAELGEKRARRTAATRVHVGRDDDL